jgi:hypothetical protein
VCTAPFDIVKTRLQTQRILGVPRYTGVRNAFVTIYREEGAAAFLRGLGPRLLMLMPAASITFACMLICIAVFSFSIAHPKCAGYEKYVKYLQARFPGSADVRSIRSKFGDS